MNELTTALPSVADSWGSASRGPGKHLIPMNSQHMKARAATNTTELGLHTLIEVHSLFEGTQRFQTHVFGNRVGVATCLNGYDGVVGWGGIKTKTHTERMLAQCMLPHLRWEGSEGRGGVVPGPPP
jgi:hypothetical protein